MSTILLLTKRHKKNYLKNFPSLMKEAITEEIVIKVTEEIHIITVSYTHLTLPTILLV